MRIHYPSQLPISSVRERIVQMIRENQVLIVAGDTGSGKTTQLPKMCIQAGLGKKRLIGCTQPRRLAAIAMAERLARELDAPDRVAWTVRFQDRCRPETRIRFMTDGILLAELRTDKKLRRYDALILDEAHERNLNIDFLLGTLKGLLDKRPDLKLIVSSATIDTEKFSDFFRGAPIVEVSGRTYPITIHYLDPDQVQEVEAGPELATRTVVDLCRKPGGDILVFMPTERDILESVATLNGELDQDRHLVLPLYGRLPAAEQRKIFRSSRKRKIIVATNVAETSITVPSIRFVVDTGLARIPMVNVRAGTTSLLVRPIAQSSCDQRAGRCGRTGPGTCWRLYTEEDYNGRERFTRPEIQRSNLAEVILRMIALGLGNPRTFPFPDPPPSRAVSDGFRRLRELGAIDRRDRITDDGRLMARLPLDPAIARILLEGARRGALAEILIICAALSVMDPRLRPADQEQQARQAQQQFVDRRSDFLTLLNIWNAWQEFSGGRFSAGKLKKFCARYYLSWQRMREWFDIHGQLNELVAAHPEFPLNNTPASYAAIHQALARGFLRRIGWKKGKNLYMVAGGGEVTLFPGSGLHNRTSAPWIVAAEFVETSRLFARTVAAIEPEWLEELAGDLCRISHTDPHWEEKKGQVRAMERVHLFGLPIVAGRKVNYGRVNSRCQKHAQDIFIRQALLPGKIRGRYPFLDHNLKLVKTIRDMEERLRRRDLLVDEEVLVDFYKKRLADAYDRPSLNRLLKQKKGDDFLKMNEQDLLLSRPDSQDLYRYPRQLECGGLTLPLSYCFEPGREQDGVSVTLSPAQVHALSPTVFEWLVPGLLEDKILHLLKGLPKKIRRRLVPLPEAVDRILDRLDQGKGSLYPALERAILREYQVEVRRDDWRIDTLPPHLLMRYVVRDDQGKILMTSRNFNEVMKRFQDTDLSLPADGKPEKIPEKRIVTDWDFEHVRNKTIIKNSRQAEQVVYPALIVRDQQIWLDVMTDQQRARRETARGLARLSCSRIKGCEKAVRRLCRESISGRSASWLSLGMQGTARELTESLIDFVLIGMFACADGFIPDQITFSRHIQEVEKQGAGRCASRILESVHRVLNERRQLVQALDEWHRRCRKYGHQSPEWLAEISARLEDLVPSDFLRTRDWRDLAHADRYLRALIIRLERAQQDPGKDRLKQKRLEPTLKRLPQLDRFRGQGPDCERLCRHYRIMVEEFRVSIFAPELGTPEPVSEKRLARLWQQVVDHCQRVE